MAEFKYQQQIDGLIKSGLTLPELFSPNGLTAFRFAFKDDKEKNHLPVSVINPSRVLPDDLKFSGYALSCYDDEQKAVFRYKNLCKLNKKMRLTLGDSLCYGKLENNDGLISEIETFSRHFDFYEYANCDLSKTFTIKRILL